MDKRDIENIKKRWPSKKCVIEHNEYGLGEVVDIDKKKVVVWFDDNKVVSFDIDKSSLVYRESESHIRT